MNKYMTQKKDYDCSPIAITNSCVWAKNKNINEKFIYLFANVYCNTLKNKGTFDEDFEQTLKIASNFEVCPFEVKKLRKVNVELITKHIKNGGAAILSHLEIWEKDPEWHHSLWIGYSNGNYKGINVKSGKLLFSCNRDYFDKLLKTQDNIEKPKIYLLTRKNT